MVHTGIGVKFSSLIQSKSLKTLVFLIGIALFAAAGCREQRNLPRVTELSESDVDFPGAQLRPKPGESSFVFAGRIRNKSDSLTLSEARLRLTMEDVLASGATTTVGSVELTLQHVIPPGQSYHFEEPLSFGSLPVPKGRYEWNYTVIGLKAKH